MPYRVFKTDVTQGYIDITDGTVNVIDTSISLVGRNYPNYGQAIAENFVHMLENFSNPSSPANPIKGQFWYDSLNEKVKIYDGLLWKSVNVVFQSTSTSPDFIAELGDILVVTNSADSADNKLKIWNGSQWYEPANVALTNQSISTLPTLLEPSSTSTILISDSGILYKISKSDFLANDVTPNLIKPGTVAIWPMDFEPSGWLICDGRSVSTSTYDQLFSIINIRYGSLAPNAFNLPNLTGPTTTGSGASVTLNYIIKT